MKRLIIFDFFGVMGYELSPKWFKAHFELEKALELKEYYFVPADNGEYTAKETLERMANDLGFKYEDIVAEFKSNVKLNTELFEYVLKLRKNNTVALLSNAANGIFDLFYPVKLTDYFDKVFISAEHKMQKPELRFYKLCIDSFKEEFDEIYFIDDNMKNLVNLESLKINPIQYKSNEELFAVLDEFL